MPKVRFSYIDPRILIQILLAKNEDAIVQIAFDFGLSKGTVISFLKRYNNPEGVAIVTEAAAKTAIADPNFDEKEYIKIRAMRRRKPRVLQNETERRMRIMNDEFKHILKEYKMDHVRAIGREARRRSGLFGN